MPCFICRYYQFDKRVVREILGKKLTGRLRKDLDDVSDKTKVSLKSCRRQVRDQRYIILIFSDQKLIMNLFQRAEPILMQPFPVRIMS